MLRSILYRSTCNLTSLVKRELRIIPKKQTKKIVNHNNNISEKTILKLEIDKLKMNIENMNDRVLSLQRTRTYVIIYVCSYILVNIFW